VSIDPERLGSAEVGFTRTRMNMGIIQYREGDLEIGIHGSSCFAWSPAALLAPFLGFVVSEINC
jgi:hypothetical protein